MELETERHNSNALKNELQPLIHNLLYPSISLERYHFLRKKAHMIPELNNSPERAFTGREEQIKFSIRFSMALKNFKEAYNLTESEVFCLVNLVSESTSINYHFTFFKPIFMLQSSQEQQAKYMKQINSMEIVASFAQTELGHGSNVRGLETQAAYEPSSDMFVIHTPTTSAIKWWVGNLGVNCNFAIVVARLIIGDTDYGPHPFFVQLRDLKTHEPLPGVELGDIGPKIGFSPTDNGYAKFTYFRVSRDCLLSRFATVKEGGEYVVLDPNGLKILYASLISARIDIGTGAWQPLAYMSTVAVRYSIVRRQFSDPQDDSKERQLIDYQVQQHKLFSGVALTYASIFVNRILKQTFEECTRSLDNDEAMQGLHAIVSLYKSFLTSMAYETGETLRRSCGGHGFLSNAGFQSHLGNILASCTYDGDNTILALQTVGYLLKIKELPANRVTGKYSVLTNPPPPLDANMPIKEYHRACLAHAAYNAVDTLYKKYEALKPRFQKKKMIVDKFLQIEGVRTCSIFFSYCLHQDFCDGMLGFGGPAVQEAMEYLRRIIACNELVKYENMINKKGEFDDVLSDALEKVRPLALGLVEAFDIDDLQLNSSLGRKDGKVYDEMIRQARYLNPINREKVFPPIRRLMRPKL